MKTDLEKKPKRFLALSKTDEGYVVSVALALVFASVLLVFYLVVMWPPSSEYLSISMLDSEKGTLNYPEVLVIDKNNTFSLWIGIENHMGNQSWCQVRVEGTNKYAEVPVKAGDPSPSVSSSLDRSDKRLENGARWEISANLTISEPGDYLVLFELWWSEDLTVSDYEFSEKICALSLEVLEKA